jgi:hypothetical protein
MFSDLRRYAAMRARFAQLAERCETDVRCPLFETPRIVRGGVPRRAELSSTRAAFCARRGRRQNIVRQHVVPHHPLAAQLPRTALDVSPALLACPAQSDWGYQLCYDNNGCLNVAEDLGSALHHPATNCCPRDCAHQARSFVVLARARGQLEPHVLSAPPLCVAPTCWQSGVESDTCDGRCEGCAHERGQLEHS